MKELQQQILEQSEKLVRRINYVMESISVAITILILYLLVNALGSIDIWTISTIVLVSFAYYAGKRWYTIRKYGRSINILYELLLTRHPQTTLYIPLFSKTYQGYITRDACLYVLHDHIFLEAFDVKRRKTPIRDSLTIKVGQDFFITSALQEQSIVTYKGKLMDKDYEFIIPYIPEVLEMLNKLLNEKED